MGKIIIGIDQSLSHTGVVVIDDQQKVLFQCLIEPKSVKKTERNNTDRLLTIKAELSAIINKYKPDITGMEDYSFATKGQAFYLGELGGMIRIMFRETNNNLIVLSPQIIKKFVTGAGNADKSLMLKEVYKRWGADYNDDNLCDAYAIAVMTKAIDGVKADRLSRKDFNASEWDAIQACIKKRVDIY